MSSEHQKDYKDKHATRLICSYEAEFLGKDQEKILSSKVDGICITSSKEQLDKTFEFFGRFSAHYAKKLNVSLPTTPALMLFVNHSYKFNIDSSKSKFSESIELAVGEKVKFIINNHSGQDHTGNKKKAEFINTDHQKCFYLVRKHTQYTEQLSISSDDLKKRQLISFIGADPILTIDQVSDLSFSSTDGKTHQVIGLDCQVCYEGQVDNSMDLSLSINNSEHPYTFDADKIITSNINYLLVEGSTSVESIADLRKLYPRDDQRSPWLIYIIDSLHAYNNFDFVYKEIDGILINRRLLAITMSPETVPMHTKDIVGKCRDMAKLTIVASQMLRSMRYNVTPTRAEVSDIANSAFDGADAVVLGSNVLKGPYGNHALLLAQKITSDVTSSIYVSTNEIQAQKYIDQEDIPMDVVCRRAVKTAQRINAQALVCITHTGNTALRLSTIETTLPIIAITFSKSSCGKLRLLRGVRGMVLKTYPDFDQFLPRVNEFLKTTSWLKPGDKVVFVTVTLSSMSKELSNLFTIQVIY